MRVKNGFQNKKKREACKSGGICEGNEGDIDGRESSVEKITEGNKKICE